MFVHIPEQLANRKDLNITDKYVAGVILGLTKKNGFCHAKNAFIANEVGTNARSISRIISRLVKAGVFEITINRTQDERGRWKTDRLIRTPLLSTIDTNVVPPLDKSVAYKYQDNKIKNTHTEQRPITNGFTREALIEWWNKRYGKKFKPQSVSAELFNYWCGIYSEKEIKVAIGSHQKHQFWGDKLTPQLLFKKRDSKGADLDVIGQLLNFETDDPQVLRFRDALKEGQQ